jgi:hypothetical protein
MKMEDPISQKSKKFLVLFSVFVLLVVSVSFWKYFIAKDYYVKLSIECDPSLETCFVSECLEGECEEGQQFRYYRVLKKKAYNIPRCYDNGDCPVLSCGVKEDCQEIICNKKNALEGESCSNYN